MSANVLNSIRFAKFITINHEAIVEIANVRFVTNKKHPQYGKCHIFTDSQSNELTWHPLYHSLYMSEEDVRKVLADNNFVEVRPDFNSHDIDHLKVVRDFLSDEWIECFNSWAVKVKG